MTDNSSDESLITELKRLRQENRSLKDRLNVKDAFLNNITDIAYITNDTGEVVWVNNAAEKITGKEKKDLIGQSFLPLFREEDHESLINVYKETLTGKQMENILTFTTGIVCHFTSLPRFGKNGEVTGTFGIGRDITERLDAEQALKHSEERLKKAQSFAKVGSWEYDIVSGKIWGSVEAFRIYGIERDSEYLSLDKVEEVILEYERVHQSLVDLIEKGVPYDIEFEILPKGSDSPRLIHSWATILCDDAGRPLKVIGVIQDITRLKQIVTENLDYEKMQSHLMDVLNAGVVVHAPDTSIVTANPAACRMLGISREGIEYKKADDTVWVFKRSDSTDMALEEFPVMQVLKTKNSLSKQIVGIYKGDLSDITWLLVDGIPIKDDSGEITQVIISFVDITELRHTHERLDEANENMKLAADSARFGIWTWYIRENRLEWDSSMYRLYGINPEDFGSNFEAWQQVVHPDDFEKLMAIVNKKLETGGQYDSQFRVVRKDGEVRYIKVHAFVTKDTSGQTVKVTGVNYDITDSVKAEILLKASDERFRDVADMAGNWIWEVDPQGKYLYSNEKVTDILGFSPDEVVGEMYFYDFFCDSDKDLLKKKVFKLFEEKLLFQGLVNKCIHKNGSEIILKTLGKPIYDTDGNYLGYRGVDWDITEQVLSETVLKKEKERAEHILQGTHAGTWDWNIQTGEIVLNERWTEIIGKELPDSCSLTDVEAKNTIHPDDLENVETLLGLIFKRNEKYYDIDFRQKHADGHWVWVSSRGKVIEWSDDGAPLRMYGTHIDITERKRMELALKNSESRFKALHNASFGGIVIHDKGRILECNQGLSDITGYDYEELIGMDGLQLISDATRNSVFEKIKSGYELPYEAEGVRKDGSVYPLRLEARNIPFRGEATRVVEFRDITEIKQSEEQRNLLQKQLAQAQKMESVGRLAGGVAHDFNNILGAIMGYTDLAMMDIPNSSPVFDCLQEIQKASLRSKELVRQLLTFSRKQLQSPVSVQINEAVSGLLKMLHRLIGEDIRLTWNPGESVPVILIDPTGLDQILVNLAINARDAIADTGSIVIESRQASSEELNCYGQPIEPGNYAVISVSDDGCGMNEQTMEKVFEPFFSTKGPGKGTGLGLSTVFGIVRQCCGYIFIDSKVGKGSTFTVALPASDQREVTVDTQKPHKDIMGQEQTVLLVEDDMSMLAMTELILNKLNYSVLKAASPKEAVSLFKKHQDTIDVILTDVIMPEMNGKDLILTLRELKPDIPYLFMSGYTADILTPHGVTEEEESLIRKPFSLEELGARLMGILKQ